jgi:hypothetical protein
MSLLRDCSGVPEFSGIAVLLIRGSPAALFYFPLVRKHLTFSSPVGACAVHDGATGTEISTSTRLADTFARVPQRITASASLTHHFITNQDANPPIGCPRPSATEPRQLSSAATPNG